ncbi:APC family permease [Metallosphaera hakonensis]|uniref:Amino acid permease n=1 Tax=Metallosphaera hakonensis JCM 8857 = DSM 7519 TaxID=1293036 RepID=A0A2U9IST6_9CREN|nr:APC family permease [Metallosphaera hakonensis]AWR99012.1 amino acid permease [Metallosphaera hakonensis JCM 8857 = DSM 7519]
MSNQKAIPKLKRGVVGTLEAIAQEIAAMAPACDTVAFITSAAAFAFVLTPLAFLLAMLTMFIEVNTLYHLSKRHASAGGYYGYTATAFGPFAAIINGLMYPVYQIASTAAIPVYVAGVVLPGVLSYFWGISLPGWIWIPFILTFILVPIGLSVIGIRPQMKYIRYAALTEIVFLAVTSLYIILKVPDNTLNVFNPFAWNSVYGSNFGPLGGPIAGLGLGMIFGLTSFIGYGGSAPLGDEVKSSKAITKALMMGVTIVGVILTEVSYALTVGWGTNNMVSFASSNIPGIIVYSHFMGILGGLMLALFAFNSAFSDSVAMQSNAGRVYFALGRDGILPRFFSYVHEKWVTPSKALLFVGIASSLLAILSGFLVGYFSGVTPSDMMSLPASSSLVSQALSNTFQYLTTIALVGFIVAHFINNTAVMVMFYRLKEKHMGINKLLHPILHYILPVIATVVFAFVLYESVWPPQFPVTEAVITGSGLLIFSIIYTHWIKRNKPEAYRRAGLTVNIVEEEKTEGLDSNSSSEDT